MLGAIKGLTCLRPSMTDEQPPIVSSGDLYRLPLEEFVAARNALARELKNKGDAEGARLVKSLSKPGLAAWITNQAVQRAPALVLELLQVTDDLAEAQRGLGRSQESHARFQDAATEQRRVIAEMMAVARVAAGETGHADDGGLLDKVENNLKWSPISSPEARETLRTGRLVRDVESPGFAALAGHAPEAARSEGRVNGSPPERKPAAAAHGAVTVAGAVAVAHAAAVEARQLVRADRRAEVQNERERARRLRALDDDLRRARAETDTARRAHQAHEAAVDKFAARVRALENELEVARASLSRAQAQEKTAADEWSTRRQNAAALEEQRSAEQKHP